MAVLAIKHEPKCKLCQHPQRSQIDTLLELRSALQNDAEGNRVNSDYVIEKLVGMGVINPTLDNLKNHWRRHCEVTTEEAVVKGQVMAAQRMLDILSGAYTVDLNAELDKLWAIGIAEIEGRIAAGEKSGITPDILMRIAQEKTRRSHNESQDELLKALAGGIAAVAPALAGAIRPALPEGPRVIGEAHVIEADAVEVES